MGTALAIRDDQTAEALRRQARREPNRRAALRMLAIANALEGMSRADSVRCAISHGSRKSVHRIDGMTANDEDASTPTAA